MLGIVRSGGSTPNSLLRVVTNDEFAAKQQAEVTAVQAAAAAQQNQMVTQLGAHLRRKWESARIAKQPIEAEMRKSLRQRRGEYEPDKLAAIKAQGGSEIYMMLTSVKCRAAASWLRDAITGQGAEKPWTAEHTPDPELPQDLEQQLMTAIGQEVGMMIAAGNAPPSEMVEDRIKAAREALKVRIKEMARTKAQSTEIKIEDAMNEGGFQQALDRGIDDLVTYKAMIVKGPVARREFRLEWVRMNDGSYKAEPVEKLVKTYHRVDPFNIYPEAWSTDIDDGGMFELHELTPSSLHALIGSPGYNEQEIRSVLQACKNGTAYTDWAGLMRQTAREINQNGTWWSEDRPIQALEYWGTVPGALLVEWGMTSDEIDDPERQYNVNCWMIAGHVIKATINVDPLGAKPYSKCSYEEIPGSFWGNGVPDIIRDLQDMCNAAARSLVNNMAMSSGPMVWVNTDRMPPGTKLTSLHPWKMFQGTSDPMGSTARPIEFFQPDSQSGELMNVFKFFSDLADEYSGIPKYMSGDGRVGGAGRTSSGLSMLMGNSTKLIKQVLGGVDRVLSGIVTRTHQFMLRYEPSDDLEGDVRIVARGVNSVAARETMQLRRNEFLAMTANPIDMQIMGPVGRAYLLREQAKLLGMNTDRIVPDPEEQDPMQMMAQMAQVMGGQGMPGMGGPAAAGAKPQGALMEPMSV